MGPEARIEERLEALRAAGLYRDPHRAAADALAAPMVPAPLDARSNDYLGLAAELAFDEVLGWPESEPPAREAHRTPDGAEAGAPSEAGARVIEGGDGATLDAYAAVIRRRGDKLPSQGAARVGRGADLGVRVGAGAARLISGTSPEHLELERQLASWLGTDACLLFSSAYAANLGTISALATAGDVVFSDALNHASIIDGCRLSRAEVVVLPHRNLSALAKALSAPTAGTATKWVVTESYFGMDGTSPDFAALRALCDEHAAALVVDEAHSLGVFGPEGRGLCAAQGARPDVLIGGFGKAFGLQGGFAASTLAVHRWLWNRARSFVFSTALSPWLARRALQHLQRVRHADSERATLERHSHRLEGQLRGAGIPLPAGRHGPIFPVVFGAEQAALDAALALRPLGVLAQAVRPPTVPRNTARLRLTLRADMTGRDVERLGAALVRVWARYGPGLPGGEVAREPAEPVSLALEAAPARRHGTSSSHVHERWVVLGTGTGVGKSFVADGLVRAIGERGYAVAGLKPIETGCRTSATGEPVAGDAARLEAASFHVRHPRPHPLYGFLQPVAPSLAARREGQTIELAVIASWVDRARSTQPGETPSLVVETAGGVFSPLDGSLTNFDLALSLGTATWVLVAPDRLGVLHDLTSTLRAMKNLGRSPDWIVLSAPAVADASTGTNAAELRQLGWALPVVEVPRGVPSAMRTLLASLEE